MLERLPEGVPVLCTTATANDRVVADVEEQLSVGRAAGLRTYRGPLGRTSLRFEVVDLPGQADRLAWLAQRLPELPGSGIVYTLTKRDADLVAEWLTGHGVAAEAYSGDSATDERIAVEERLLRNDLKAVVATSALGMGYDKPDLGFVVHYQAPGSVIAYYQQVGRAGRAIERAEVVLLRGARGPPDPGLLHRAGVPAPRARRPRARADRRRGGGRRLHPGADGRGQPRQGPRRGDAEGARRRGRGRARRLALARAARQRLELRRRALRAHHRAAAPRAGRDGPARRRRALPDARAAGGARRPRAGGLRALLGLRRAALRRAAGPRARARGVAAPALAPARARGQEDGAGRRGRDAQDPRRRARRGGPRARAARRRRLGPARARRPQRRALRRRARRGRRRGRARLGRRRSSGSPRSRRSAAASSSRASRARSPSGSGSPTRRCSSASPTARRSARWPTPTSRSPTSAAASRSPPRRRRAPACSSTTSASAAGRSRWSPASCAARAPRRSTRSRSSTAF